MSKMEDIKKKLMEQTWMGEVNPRGKLGYCAAVAHILQTQHMPAYSCLCNIWM